MPRTGWVLRGVENPETIAEHTFGLSLLSWLLAKRSNLNQRRAIKIALFHDLCEVYAGDITPQLYYPYLPRNKKERKEMLMKWTRLSRKEKQEKGKIKFKKERAGLLKLTEFLDPELKNKIFSLWLEYEKGISKEGKFVNQLNRIETLLQSIKFFGTKENSNGTNWWEWVEEIVEDPALLRFLEVVQKKFYKKDFASFKEEKDLENILNFIQELGKLKKMPRLYWLMRGIKEPETVAGHIFTLTLMAWVLGSQKKGLNMEKLLKMALCHEITAIGTGDTTPYDDILPQERKEREKILKKMPRLLKKEKLKRFLKDYKKEKNTILKLTLKLTPELRKEIFRLWHDYRKRASPESHFLNQLNVLAVLLQGLLERQKRKDFSVGAIWEWAFEVCDDPVAIRLMDELKKRFY